MSNETTTKDGAVTVEVPVVNELEAVKRENEQLKAKLAEALYWNGLWKPAAIAAGKLMGALT